MKLPYLAAIVTVSISLSGYAADTVDWSNLTLDQLKNIKVTSVSKKSEDAFDAAAAIYVITKEDIRRSGATSIAEALRMAPGVQVARAGANKWAISIRGFNQQFSNKLLVLIDGRIVYSPTFSGVYWGQQDTLLEDVKQIEVIRGPGATLWGSNAVNGIINIITEESVNTQGKLISTTVGKKEKSASTRVGGKLGDKGHYRIYAKYGNNDSEDTVSGDNALDSFNSKRSGFRADLEKEHTTLTIQGDIYQDRENRNTLLASLTAPFVSPIEETEAASGGNISIRGKYLHDNGSDSVMKIYFDNAKRESIFWKQDINTFDIDLQHSLPLLHRNEITLGTGYRLIKDSMGNTPYVFYSPEDERAHVINAFVQDKIHLVENKLFLTLGTKYEYNIYSQGEIQPSASLTYLPSTTQTLWTSVSRAVHTPDRNMSDITFNAAGTPGGFFKLVGNRISGRPKAVSEELIAYEAGYRIRPTKSLSFDTTIFYNDYDKIISNVQVDSLTLSPANDASGESHGLELSSKWDVTKKWNLSASYTLIRTSLTNNSAVPSGKTPNNQYNFSSNYKFSDKFDMSNLLYKVGELHSIGVPAYTRFDTVFTWKPENHVEFNLVGQNLFSPPHQEFENFFYSQRQTVGQAVYANIKIRFN